MKLQSLLQRQNEGDEKDLSLVKLKFFDCLIMHFLSFQRFYMKEKVTFGFVCVCVCACVSGCPVICIPQHATITTICLCSTLSSVQSSMAFTLVAFKMN